MKKIISLSICLGLMLGSANAAIPLTPNDAKRQVADFIKRNQDVALAVIAEPENKMSKIVDPEDRAIVTEVCRLVFNSATCLWSLDMTTAAMLICDPGLVSNCKATAIKRFGAEKLNANITKHKAAAATLGAFKVLYDLGLLPKAS